MCTVVSRNPAADAECPRKVCWRITRAAAPISGGASRSAFSRAALQDLPPVLKSARSIPRPASAWATFADSPVIDDHDPHENARPSPSGSEDGRFGNPSPATPVMSMTAAVGRRETDRLQEIGRELLGRRSEIDDADERQKKKALAELKHRGRQPADVLASLLKPLHSRSAGRPIMSCRSSASRLSSARSCSRSAVRSRTRRSRSSFNRASLRLGANSLHHVKGGHQHQGQEQGQVPPRPLPEMRHHRRSVGRARPRIEHHPRWRAAAWWPARPVATTGDPRRARRQDTPPTIAHSNGGRISAGRVMPSGPGCVYVGSH